MSLGRDGYTISHTHTFSVYSHRLTKSHKSLNVLWAFLNTFSALQWLPLVANFDSCLISVTTNVTWIRQHTVLQLSEEISLEQMEKASLLTSRKYFVSIFFIYKNKYKNGPDMFNQFIHEHTCSY